MGLNKKTSLSIIWLMGCLIAVGLLSACSEAVSDEESLDAEKTGNQSNLGQDDAAEGNGQENFVDAGNSGGDSAEVNSDTSAGGDLDLGAAKNSTAAVETPTNINGNLSNGTNPSAVDSSDALLGGADLTTPTNAATNQNTPAATNSPDNTTNVANAANASNTATLAKPFEPVAPASPGSLTPINNGRVRYVKEGGVQIRNSSNGGSTINLEQGDHPVTWEENGMLKVADGLYVPVDGMSVIGVGRSRRPRPWGQQ